MLKELIRKDLKIFLADKRGVIVSIAVPVALASFMALIFGGLGSGGGNGPKKNAVPIAIVDLDQSPLSKALVEDLAESKLVEPRAMRQDQAMGDVKLARISAALILPEGFGKQSTAALFNGEVPRVQLIFDPPKSAEVQIVRGAMMQSAMKVVTREAFSPANWRATSQENLARIEQSSSLSAVQKATLRALFSSLDPVFARLSEQATTRPGATSDPSAGVM